MQVARPEAQPTIKSMSDVDRICFNTLEKHSLRLQPHVIRGASGKEHVALLMDIGNLAKVMSTDPATAETLDLFGGRVEPPGTQTDSGLRIFGSIMTGDWAVETEAKLPRGTQLLPMSCFWDDTVDMSTGTKYCGLQMYNNLLPLNLRFRTDQIWIFGFAPIVTPPTTDPQFTALSKGKRAEWLKAERDSIRVGVLEHLLQSFRKHEAGILLGGSVQGHSRRIVIPVLACWWVDHPQHMAMVACKQCGFCNVGGRGKQGLAAFGEQVELRSTAGVRALVKSRDRSALIAAGVHGVELPQWQESYTDAYQNTSISALHVLKGVYKDTIEWTLQVWLGLGIQEAIRKRLGLG
jgi:hypothetical protein|tara:strand:- start:82 stop:1131 length:1050 start_codon:yes stop_codon:yes gene_type:complete